MTEDALGQCLVNFGNQLSSLNLDEKDMKTAERSRELLLLPERAFKSNGGEGDVVSVSDSSDQEIWNRGVSSVLGEHGREMIKKPRAAIRRKAVRETKKKIMNEGF